MFNRFIDLSIIINKSLIIIFQMNPQRNETMESCSDHLQLAAAVSMHPDDPATP